MEIDPHTLQQILQRIHQQMRCPQCGKRVPVDFSSVRIVSGEGLLLQVKCEGCNAFIVLHASLQGADRISVQPQQEETAMNNASSTLSKGKNDAELVRQALQGAGGSFTKIFKDNQKSAPDTNIA